MGDGSFIFRKYYSIDEFLNDILAAEYNTRKATKSCRLDSN